MMSFSLTSWTHPASGKQRLYINGTTRPAIYFSRAQDGRVVWSSKALDTPTKSRTGNHYGKVNKDQDAALGAAEAFGVKIGTGTGDAEWAALIHIATNNLSYEAAETD